MRIALELADLVNGLLFSVWASFLQCIDNLNGTNRRQRKEEFILFSLPPSLIYLGDLISSSALGLGFTSLSPLVLRPLDSD